jgi:parvulin-like peptidyl-prolyl isomerase
MKSRIFHCRNQSRFFLAAALLFSCLANAGVAAGDEAAGDEAAGDEAAGDEAAEDPKKGEAAWVNGEAIAEAHVQWEIRKFLADTPADEERRDVVRNQAVELLVRRQLVIQYLRKNKLSATKQEVDLEIQRIEKRLKRVEKTLQQFLDERGTDHQILRRDIEWQMTWRRALSKYLTPESTSKYFAQRKRHFDGSRLHVAHILLKVSDQRGTEECKRELTEVRKKIQAKELTFSNAAKKHSAAPTKDKGGDMGWIERKDPMPESFSRPAFDLAIGEVSEPIVTPFGVHLITVLGHEPGKKTEKDVADAVHDDMRQYMFDWLAEKNRKEAEIKIVPRPPRTSNTER